MIDQIKAGIRKQRPNSNKRRAVEVMLNLILETGKMPAVEEVLERSGISRRSFFRFFPSESARILDVDILMMQRLEERFNFPAPDSRRSLEETLKLFVDLKSRVDEYRMPMRKLAEEKRNSNPEVEEYLRKGRIRWSKYIDDLFSPHLADRSDRKALLQHIHFNTSWTVWAILRCDFAMNVAESQVFIERQIMALLDTKLR